MSDMSVPDIFLISLIVHDRRGLESFPEANTPLELLHYHQLNDTTAIIKPFSLSSHVCDCDVLDGAN